MLHKDRHDYLKQVLIRQYHILHFTLIPLQLQYERTPNWKFLKYYVLEQPFKFNHTWCYSRHADLVENRKSGAWIIKKYYIKIMRIYGRIWMKQTMVYSPAYPICKMQVINIADTVLGSWQYCRNMTVLSYFYMLCLCSMSHKSWSSCGRFYSYPPGLWTNVLISLRVISLALWQSFDYPGACVVFLVYMEKLGDSIYQWAVPEHDSNKYENGLLGHDGKHNWPRCW